ncbi:MAG: molybdenum cofactor biosynthesis protein MoaE [Gammaproteobacteria bacterium]|nr:molybdenum cofactor biosynthesis protein MoaE [Gammaproteobacteria bacterium]MCY4217795.1 molybdenum cofactor biosynthesis protein MoaE [Gammaproteobacteria bacterium]MCY4274681.1 molybdenum cofactor biosynthesis protein MoaE [Gammaproteobacteria bacterium]
MHIQICPEAFDPWSEISDYPARSKMKPGSYGACSVFVGFMRDFNLGNKIQCLELEHYHGMTEKLLTEHAEKVDQQYGLLELLVLHRVGMIYPQDPIVLVATWSAHRAEAFKGCHDMMEYLKANATFWKKESLANSQHQRWVDSQIVVT